MLDLTTNIAPLRPHNPNKTGPLSGNESASATSSSAGIRIKVGAGLKICLGLGLMSALAVLNL